MCVNFVWHSGVNHGLSMDRMGNDVKIRGRCVSNHQSSGISSTIIRGLERTMTGIFHGIPNKIRLKSIHLPGMFTELLPHSAPRDFHFKINPANLPVGVPKSWLRGFESP